MEVEVCGYVRLLKMVYGVKQAGRAWFETSDSCILGYDSRLKKNTAESPLYCCVSGELAVLFLVYVETTCTHQQ